MAQQNAQVAYRKRNLNYLPESDATAIVGGVNTSKLANNVVAPVAQGSEALMRGVQNIPIGLGSVAGAIKSTAQIPSRLLIGSKGTEEASNAISNTSQQGLGYLSKRLSKGVSDFSEGAKDYGVVGGLGSYLKGVFDDGVDNSSSSPETLPAKTAMTSPPITQAESLAKAAEINKSIRDNYQASQAIDNSPELSQSPVASQSQQPYQMRGGLVGAPVNTLSVENGQGGSGVIQFKNGRKLNNEQLTGLQATLAREADPAFKARLAEQAAIVDARYAAAREGRDRSRTMAIEDQVLNGGSKTARASALGVLGNRGSVQKAQLEQQGLAAKAQQDQLNKLAELGLSRDKLGFDSQVFTPGQKMTDAEGNVTLTDPSVYNKATGEIRELGNNDSNDLGTAYAKLQAAIKASPDKKVELFDAFLEDYVPNTKSK